MVERVHVPTKAQLFGTENLFDRTVGQTCLHRVKRFKTVNGFVCIETCDFYEG